MNSSTQIFVGGLSKITTEDTLITFFSQYGKILDANIIRDMNTGEPRGYGFIFVDDDDLAKFLIDQQYFYMCGKKIDVKSSIYQTIGKDVAVKPDNHRIFVGGVSSVTTEDDIRTYFESFGQVTLCRLIMDHMTGRSRNYAFVTFADEECANRALKLSHYINQKKVDIGPARFATDGTN